MREGRHPGGDRRVASKSGSERSSPGPGERRVRCLLVPRTAPQCSRVRRLISMAKMMAFDQEAREAMRRGVAEARPEP
jgi:hypothetical protein